MNLPASIQRIVNNSFFRFLFVGGINTLFGYGLFCAAYAVFKNTNVSVAVATAIAVLFNFKTYSKLVFKSKDNSKIFRFFGVYLFTMLIQMGLLKLLAKAGVHDTYIAGGMLMIPMAVLSFLLMRKFVFYTVATK